MNTENIVSNEGQLESGESRDIEKEKLDDATHEPRSFVEQNGDYEQAEDIQKTLEDLPLPCCPPGDLPSGSGYLGGEEDAVDLEEDNSVTGRMPKMREDLSDLEPADSKDDDGKHEATPITIPGPQEPLSEQASVRGDLDQITESTDDNKDEATPINLPGPQTISHDEGATPLPIPQPEGTSGQNEATPIPIPGEPGDKSILGQQAQVRGDLDQVTLNEGGETKDEATPINLPGPQAESKAAEDDWETPIQSNVELTPDDVKNEVELTPDDVKLDENEGRQDDWTNQ